MWVFNLSLSFDYSVHCCIFSYVVKHFSFFLFERDGEDGGCVIETGHDCSLFSSFLTYYDINLYQTSFSSKQINRFMHRII